MALATNGQTSSADALNTELAALRASGTSVLSLLGEIELTTLVDYDRALTGLQLRQHRAARVKAPGIYSLFIVSDFETIDQGQTTATVRADTASATLRESRSPASALVSSTSFTASSGNVVALSADETLLSVVSSSVPTGTFTLTLQRAVDLSVLTLSLSSMASKPSVTLQVSSDGLVYTPAATLSFVGNTLNAWFPSTPVRYIQLILTPSQPDNLGGDTYTFGLTAFSGTTSSYDLVSDVYFKGTIFKPSTQTAVFLAQGSGALTYYLKLDTGNGTGTFVPVVNGSVVQIPGVSSHSLPSVGIDNTGNLNTAIPANAYLSSLTVKNNVTGNLVPIAIGIPTNDPGLAAAGLRVATLSGTALYIVPTTSSSTDTYTVSYLTGPSTVTATLIAHLSTTDRTQTPVFKGASLEAQ